MAALKGTGAEDKKKLALAVILGVLVVGLAVHTIFSGEGATTAVVSSNAAVQNSPVQREVGVPTLDRAATGEVDAGAEPEARILASGMPSLDPKLHPELMAGNEDYLYRGSGRNIFSAPAEQQQEAAALQIEKVRAPIRPTAAPVEVAMGPPQPPAVELKFFGYSARTDGSRHAFLLHGDSVFIAGEGDVVDHRYKVVKIAPFSVQVEDLPYSDTQTLPLTRTGG
jgi:hypothetical protein